MTEILEAAQREFGDPEYESRRWAESLNRYNLRTEQERRRAWLLFHERQALTFRQLASEHERAITALLQGNR